METSRAHWATIVILAALTAGSEAGRAAAEAQTQSRARTWRAGELDGRSPGTADQGDSLCAALASLEGLDLYVAVSRGEARAGDVLVHLACGTGGPTASRAALIALAVSGDRQDVQVLLEVAASRDPVRAADAVEALLLAGLPVDADTVVGAYRSSGRATRRRLLVAMSAAGATEALAVTAGIETDEDLAREARRRLDALR